MKSHGYTIQQQQQKKKGERNLRSKKTKKNEEVHISSSFSVQDSTESTANQTLNLSTSG